MRTQAALAYSGNPVLSIEEVEIDEPGPGEILVETLAAGLCHTDETLRRGWPASLSPMVFGHEGAGRVLRTGAGVSSLAPGDHVVLSFASCGDCPQCRGGFPGYCTEFVRLNASGVRESGRSGLSLAETGEKVHGGFFGQSSFARHVLASARSAVRVPAAIDLSEVAALGCGAITGAGAVLNVMRPEEGDSVVVFGAGAVGLSAVMAAVAIGVKRVVVVDPVESRRELALELGAAAAIDAADDVPAALAEAVAGGFEYALDTTARTEVLTTALANLAPRGTLVAVGVGLPQLEIDLTQHVRSGRTLRGCIEGDADPSELIPKLLEWIEQGRFPLGRLVQRFEFERINEAVEASASGAAVKPVLVF